MNKPKQYRKINRILDRDPLLFGILPGNLLVPIGVSFFIAYLPIGIFNQHWVLGIVLFLILIISWAILTHSGSYILLSRLEPPPKWFRAIVPYRSILREIHERDYRAAQKAQKTKSQKRSKSR